MAARSSALVIALTVFVCAAVPAGAQATARPYRSLFGPAERDATRADQFTLTGSLYAGLDDTSRLATGSVLDESLQTGRAHQGVTLALAALRRRPRTTLTIAASSAVRYYSSLNRIGTQKHGGGVGFQVLASRRLTLRIAQDVNYSPSYQLALGQAPAPDGSELTFDPAGVDYSVSRDKQITYGTYAGGTYVWNSSRDLTFGYGLNYANYFTRSDFGVQLASVRYTQRLTPGVSLRLGYGLGSGSMASLRSAAHHDLDVGLVINRSFAFSPRTAVGFTSGSTVVSVDDRRQFELIGSATLRHQLSPRWTSSIGYQRGLTAIDGTPRPFVAATVNAEVNGFVGSRTKVTIQPGYARGADVADAKRTFQSGVSLTRVEAAVTRHWAIFAEHFYYRYRFAGAPDLPPALAAGLNRQGMRWGLSLWTPVIR